MVGLVINIFKGVITILLKIYKPRWLLRLDKYLEQDSHPPCPLEEFDAYPALIRRIEKLEKKVK